MRAERVSVSHRPPATAKGERRDFLLIARLALADAADDRFQAACVVIALTAVIAPLLILLGLRVGLVGNLRDAMVEDPVFRELTPAETMSYDETFFASLAAREDVAFVLPHILAGASVITAKAEGGGAGVRPNLVPSGPGDALLDAYGAPDVGANAVVVSGAVASALDLSVGDAILLHARRSVGGRSEEEIERFGVAGVLPARAERRPVVFASAAYVFDVERYREGFGVPARGWPGRQARPSQRFDGAVVLTSAPIPDDKNALARSFTGMTSYRAIEAVEFAALVGSAPTNAAAAGSVFLAKGTSVGRDGLSRLEDELRPLGAVVLPFARLEAVSIRYQGADAVAHVRETPLVGLTLKDWQRERVAPSPPWDVQANDAPFSEIAKMLIPEAWPDSAAAVGKTAEVMIEEGVKPFAVEIPIVGLTTGDRPIVPTVAAGLLRAGLERALDFDSARGELLQERAGFRGFRLYARSIDDVAPILGYLAAQGISVRSRQAAIERVKTLDRALLGLFVVIASLGVIGGATVLATNTLAIVRRKTRDLGMLRLLGFEKKMLFFFPVVQVILFSVASLVISLLIFYCAGFLVEFLFPDEVGFGEDLCRLRSHHLIFFTGVVLAIAFLSSLAGGFCVLGIDPREALRDE